MRKFISALLLAIPFACNAQMRPLTEWKMSGAGVECDAAVPCTVAGALNESGYFGENVLEQNRYFDIDRTMFDQPWTFRTSFKAEKGRRSILRFEGLDWYADILVNGTAIASSDTTKGMFCVREFDVTDLAKPENDLEVVLKRAQKGDLNVGYVDWNPRPVDESMGIIRPVYLIGVRNVEVADVFVKPIVNTRDLTDASIEVRTTLINRSDRKVSGRLVINYDGRKLSRKISLAAGEKREVCLTDKVKNPRIWWSHDLGKPELYTLKASFTSGLKESDSREVTFGLRSIESEIDEYGHRQFILNGRKVLIKSAGWTDDIFMQDNHRRTAIQLEYVKDMNLNSVRFENIWGKTSEVYDLCDSLGLLAMVGWSCQWEWEDYCGLPETRGLGCINDPVSEDMAVRYFHDQVIWMRNHPSVICWFTGSDRIPNERLEARYMEIYNKEDYRPYVCSAKGLASKYGGPSGVKMEGPYEYVGPDYWYLDTRKGGAFGFNTETCAGMSMPQEESIRRFIASGSIWPLGDDWSRHCSASTSAMNNMDNISRTIDNLYGEATGFEDFIRKAHSVDYDATRAMFEAFRCNLPKTTGIVQWMLNSAWPAFYWQLYDWYLVPTAGYYAVKKACAPVQVVFNYGDRRLYAVNETSETKACSISMERFDTLGHSTGIERQEVTLEDRMPVAVSGPLEGAGFVQTFIGYEGTSQENFYALPAGQNTYNWKKANWCVTPITDWVDMKFVYKLPAADVKVRTSRDGNAFTITLTNESDHIAWQNVLKAKLPDGSLCVPATFSDNFFPLAPGQTREITCSVPDAEEVTITLAAE